MNRGLCRALFITVNFELEFFLFSIWRRGCDDEKETDGGRVLLFQSSMKDLFAR